MTKLAKELKKLFLEIESCMSQRGLLADEQKLNTLKHEMAKPDFWANNQSAAAIAKEEAELSQKLQPWLLLKDNTKNFYELAKDKSLVSDIEAELPKLQSEFSRLKKTARQAGPYDDHDVILSIYAGAGGTDAQDWVQILLRMYVRWAESEKIKVMIIDQSSGEEAGLKSVSFKLIGGRQLYGRLAGEHGVHRLIRLSPFNADHKRQTSFAKVEVLPLIDSPREVTLNSKDLKIDVFRSTGAGGQSVNTTDSAVRVTHLPTGISVAIQNERSQLQNKETALAVLRSKLASLQLEQHAQSLADIKGPSQSAEWGNQIRNYVLHPYKQVKDLRTGYETTNAEKVLDGQLEPLINAWQIYRNSQA